MSNPQAPPHLLVFPFPAQGHLIPLLDLTHHLSTLLNLSITILTTPRNLPLLSPLLSSSPSIQPLILPFPSHPSLPPDVEHVRDLPSASSTAALIHALSFLRPQILSWARSVPNPPSAILSDFFLGWTHHLAEELSIPRITFYSSGALLVSVFDHVFLHGPAPLPSPLPSFPYHHLPSMFRRYTPGVPESEFTRDSMIANASCHAAVLNTFNALESQYLAHLKRTYGHDRIWAVGPILPSLPASIRGGRSSIPTEELTAWLDSCPPKSVVYVCFGSQFELGGAHMRALADALVLSGVRFVWCAGPTVVPEGFEERAKGRGLVIKGWAPQVAVLSHGSVGSFLTHCGWNSVLEGIVAGVVLLAWPMQADQFVNARLLVEEEGVAVSACEGGPTVVPEAGVLARVFSESVDEGMWVEMKERAKEMGRKAAEAVGEGGSSYSDLEKLVKELTELTVKEKI